MTSEMLTQLFKSLHDYNPTVYDKMGLISNALIPVSTLLIGIFFMIELANWRKMINTEDGGLTMEMMLTIGLGYALAIFLAVSSGVIIDSIGWIGVKIAQIINGLLPVNIEWGKVNAPTGSISFWQKGFVYVMQGIAQFIVWIQEIVVTVLIWLRSIELYIFKGIAPVLIAFFMHQETRPLAINFFKRLGALALQASVIVLIVGLYPLIMSTDLTSSFAGTGSGAWYSNLLNYFGIIVKGIIMIWLLLGAQRKSKEWMGV